MEQVEDTAEPGMKRAVVMGASSGIGNQIARLLLQRGYKVGVAARRTEKLQELQQCFPNKVCYAQIDVTREDAPDRLNGLVHLLGGMDLYIHVSGIGFNNIELHADKEVNTARTNATGFIRMISTAFNYLASHGGGQLVAISSIAGTKGLGCAPAYSATKALQATYLEALEQLSVMRKLNIRVTDIRPGFVDTALLGDGLHYPYCMDVNYAARKIVKAIEQHRHVAVIDGWYRLLTMFWRIVPRCLWRHLPIYCRKEVE